MPRERCAMFPLDFMSGEVHCLAGQNGCGKSTLIKNYVRCLSPG
ncbi:ATP-binding cassette domain-containing protein [Escherichia coli]|nr:ATP-binding cassette domain-containing protein [Escherichia coli]